MASVINGKNNSRRIQFMDNGERRLIAIGQVNKTQAEEFKDNIEAIIKARRIGAAIGPALSDWLRGLPDDMHARLAEVGLVEARAVAATAPAVLTLRAMLDRFIAQKDVKPATAVRIEQAKRNLLDHFGQDRRLADISDDAAAAWRANLADGYSQATVSRTVLYAREIFRWAHKRGLVKSNPFADLKAGTQVNKARARFIDRPTIEKVLDAAPDAEWRLMIALSRYGGLRVPSEALTLTWADVDFDRSTMTIRSPKVEHHEAGGVRTVPIFPELRPYLEDAREVAPADAEHVISGYRAGANVNPQFRRIIKKAGLTPWPRTWHNMRASRQTELCREFPLATACAWIGNSKAIAAGHYLQETDADWQRAIGCANSVQQVADDERTSTHAEGPTPRRASKNDDGRSCAPIRRELSGQGRT